MPESPSCTIRTLPADLLDDAARVAAEVFPANRPAVQQFATLMRAEDSDAIAAPGFIAALTTKYWGPTPRTIPVSFLDNPDAATINLVLAHMNAWAESGCISFAWSQSGGKVRIARGGGGYWSYLGTDVLLLPPGQPTMNLQGFTSRTPDAECRRIIRHETGHTLGFPHEHMRKGLVARLDVEKTVAYFAATQGWSRRDVLAQVLTPLDEASLMSTPADEDSIMCYQLPAEITINGIAIPGGADINASDAKFNGSIHPKSAGPTPPTPPVVPPAPPKPPEPEPPTPTEEFGPFDLKVGVPSDGFTMLPGASVLFRFRARGHRTFVAATAGNLALTMALMDGSKRPIKADEDFSGKDGNAMVGATLRPGTYVLRVRGAVPEMAGAFRVKVVSL